MISTGKGKVTELRLHSDNRDPEKTVRRGKKSGNFMLLLTVACVCYMVFSLYNQFTRMNTMQSSMKTLQTQVEELKNRNEALRTEIKQIKSEAYIEQAAREQLGLVKPGETLVVPTQPKQTSTASEQKKSSKSEEAGAEAFDIKYKNIYD
ncbi:Septum formation initiator [Desulforamulus reducens MI-1]|uniref:Septum formation initiator n=1 Tax=Desulforamulus reducens (strain ATCC BAA-1160 / DSM 100696 / MI-1) TaxID=349161 RepID=A4J0R8_DESRM|nr:septum formation initiator family protein [Desulforamulus reducens]ABO48671.1 Septum formation initiator [Desulforamulus reducens MI-1]